MRPSGARLLEWLASVPSADRERAIEAHLGIDVGDAWSAPLGEHSLGYHASGVGPIVRALAEVPVTRDDVVVDLGCGAGKVVLLASLLTGATARGIDIQPGLIEAARAAAERLEVDATFEAADARDADIGDATVVYLYTPCTGPLLATLLSRMHEVAMDHALVVCALGLELDRLAPWLRARPTDAFWLTLYDSVVDGVAPRTPRASLLDGRAFAAVVEG